MRGPKPTPVERRFWSKVSPEPTSGCFLWVSSFTGNGYGAISVGSGSNKRLRPAHRVAWEMVNGPIPEGLFVCHKCDNRGCVNPTHMFLGTNLDNMRDMVAKGRQRNGRDLNPLRGEDNPTAKLTEADVRFIRASSEGPRSLARRYGVAPSNICQIRNRETWKHVGEEAA